MDNKKQVIIIDDDAVNNFICRETIKTVTTDYNVVDFTRPMEALNYILENYKKGAENPSTILFLDLNMNMMTGWEFIEEFCRFDQSITKAFQIYILSSSLDEADRHHAASTPLVKDFVLKPLSAEVLEKIL